ncbi:hypothetical protein [Thalassovita taeanensis]|uniref:Uncharacterized protein n=1 Tax=Thalassovita taeanensis TaxID=657014 RepID=A0A1H9JVU2_9RHOB|nr:hypothetical protein [Thalassovita taeanensis]SEQ90853.1 hypothetical protein SAMN04488092_11649 [Thalassovita taeanensis]
MPRWTPAQVVVEDVPEEILNQPPNQGGRPEGAKDKVKTGKRNRSRQTEKAKTVTKAAEWHVASAEMNIEVTFQKFFEEYAGGPAGDRRYFKSQLIAKIDEITS